MDKEKLVKLSEKSWSYRLIKFVFEIEPKRFKNFCPYFWLSVLGLILFPLKLIIRTPIRTWSRFRYQKALKTLGKPQIYYLKYHPYIGWGDIRERHLTKITNINLEFHKTNEDILEDIKKLWGISDADISGYEEDWNSEIESISEGLKGYKKRLDRLSVITEKIMGIIMSGMVIFGGFFVLTALLNVIYFLMGIVSKDFLSFLGFLVATCLLLLSMITWVNCRIDVQPRPQYAIPLWIITFPLTGMMFMVELAMRGSFRFCDIFWKYLKESYNNYCPGIDWREEE